MLGPATISGSMTHHGYHEHDSVTVSKPTTRTDRHGGPTMSAGGSAEVVALLTTTSEDWRRANGRPPVRSGDAPIPHGWVSTDGTDSATWFAVESGRTTFVLRQEAQG